MMSPAIGIGLSFVAMLCWGFGDFFIQRSTRKIGNWETLFVITFFGAIVLLPFVYKNLPRLFESISSLEILVGGSFILFIAALLDFEALRQGKLAVVEPIWSFEVPASGLLAFFVLNEKLGTSQILLITALVIGLALVSFRRKFFSHKFLMEKGVLIAFFCGFLDGRGQLFCRLGRSGD